MMKTDLDCKRCYAYKQCMPLSGQIDTCKGPYKSLAHYLVVAQRVTNRSGCKRVWRTSK